MRTGKKTEETVECENTNSKYNNAINNSKTNSIKINNEIYTRSGYKINPPDGFGY